MPKIKSKTNKALSILQAAEKLFNQYGYKKVSIDEIVKNAHIAKGTFYLYFKNKEEVYTQIIEKYFEKKAAYTTRALDDIKKNEKEKLFEAMIGNLLFLIKNPILREIFLQNPNYISKTINRDSLQNKNMAIIKPIFKTCTLRKDISINNNPHKHCEALNFLPMLLATYKKHDSKVFWTCTENLLKIWIDGLTSKYEWKNKSALSIISPLEKEIGI